MSIKKQALKSKPVSKVSFKISKSQAEGAAAVSVVGEFNNWDQASGTMGRLKDGSFSFSAELPSGREYQFRYVADGTRWFNDEEADGLVPSGMGSEQNSLLSL
jgi:1,4-alpha-glucan branching enzyme